MTSLIAYLENDNVVSLWARDAIDGADLSGATVTYTLKDSTATVDSGSVVYDTTGTSGGYTYYIFRVVMPYTVSLDADTDYYIDVNFDGGVGKVAKWSNVPVDAQVRSS